MPAVLASRPLLRRHDENGLIASYKNLMMSVHWGATTRSHADDLKTHTAELVRQHHKFASMVLVSGPRMPEAPDAETRESLRQLIEQTEDTGVGTAFVVTAGGFLGGAAVALLSGLFILSGSREPHKAFRTVSPAADWLQGCVASGPTRWDAGEVQAAIRAVTDLDPRSLPEPA